jgi:hypothetical protein
MKDRDIIQWVKDGKPQNAFVTISPEGEISRVVNNAKDSVASLDLIRAAIQRGGKTIDAWDIHGKLPKLYEGLGFEKTETVPYDVKNYGEPSQAYKDHWKRFGWKEGEPYPSVTKMQLKDGGEAAPAPTDLASKEIATRRPTSTKGNMVNNPANLSGMEAVDAADKQAPSRTSKAGTPILGVKEKLASALSNYPDSPVDLSPEELRKPASVIEKHIQHYADNIRALYHAIPDAIRGPAKAWYVTAHNLTKAMSEKYGILHEQAAGVVAALSPKNAWDNNVGTADRLMDMWKNQKGHEWSPEMDKAASDIRKVATTAKKPSRDFIKLIDQVRGKTFDELTAKQLPDNATAEQIKDNQDALRGKQALWFRLVDEAHGAKDFPARSPEGVIHGSTTRAWIGIDPIAKALDILDNGDIQHIHDVMGQGHKLRNFYNNIINPWSERGHVTIDTHAVGAAHMKPLSQDDLEVAQNFGSSLKGIPGAPGEAMTGIKGTYPVYEEAYRRVAAELGIHPNELQSITWEGIKSLMGDDKKTPELREAVQNIWDEHKAGKISIDDARTKIIDAAGGFSKPDWMPESDWEKSKNQGEEFSTE